MESRRDSSRSGPLPPAEPASGCLPARRSRAKGKTVGRMAASALRPDERGHHHNDLALPLLSPGKRRRAASVAAGTPGLGGPAPVGSSGASRFELRRTCRCNAVAASSRRCASCSASAAARFWLAACAAESSPARPAAAAARSAPSGRLLVWPLSTGCADAAAGADVVDGAAASSSPPMSLRESWRNPSKRPAAAPL